MSEENLPAKEIAKVTNNFINKVSKAIGAVYEPFHLTRMAKAEAKAKTIRVQGDVEVTDIQLRAERRWLHEEMRNQENIEEITRKAIPDLRPDARPEAIDDDWMTAFFDYAKKVSDDQMQSLWAKILAGQANAPGSFKKRVLQSVALLEKEDAELFTSLCRFCVNIEGLTPIIFSLGDETPYSKEKLDFEAFSHLDTVGLVQFNSFTGFVRQGLPRQFIIGYGEQRYSVQLPDNKKDMPIGLVLLTDVGRQLAPLSNPKVVPGFDDYFTVEWKREGIAVIAEHGLTSHVIAPEREGGAS